MRSLCLLIVLSWPLRIFRCAQTLGEEAAHRIRRGTVVTTTALVAAVLPCAGVFVPGLRMRTVDHAATSRTADDECGVMLDHGVEFEVLCDWCSWLAGD
jgi:hypothetical protein